MGWQTRTGTVVICVTLMAAALLAANSLTQRDSNPPAPNRYWHELPPEHPTTDISVATSRQSTQIAARFRFEPATLDLGLTMKGAERTASIQLMNPTASAIFVESVSSDCGCVSIDPVLNVEITAESELEIPIRFKAPGRAGRVRRSMIVATTGTGEKVWATVISRIVEAVTVIEGTIESPYQTDTFATVRAMDGAPFRVINSEPPIGGISSICPAIEHRIAVSPQEWRRAGKPTAIVLHTDHSASPLAVIRFKTHSCQKDHCSNAQCIHSS
jgi:hypothetical protein